MQTQDHKKTSSSGHGVHVCHKCGWPFPNAHPSSKHRRSHKKICGTIQGYNVASSEETNPNLNDDVSKSPSNGSNVVEKAAEMTISLSNRSDEDVYSDAKTDFGEPPAVAGYVAVRERDVVMQDLSEDFGDNLVPDAGDLYPPNIDDDVEFSRPEDEKLETVTPSQFQLSSSALDSISNSDSTVKEASVSESTSQCSMIDIVQDSVEKGIVGAALAKNSEDLENQSSEEISFPQKVNGNYNDFSTEIHLDDETNRTGELETSEDLSNAHFESAVKTVEAVSAPELVTVDSLEYFPASAVMEVTGDQPGEFDAEIDCFSKDEIAEKFSDTEEGPDSHVENTHVLNEFSKGGVIDDNEEQKTEKLPDDVTLDVNKEAVFSTPLAEPSKSQNKNSEDMISETVDQQDYSAEENKMEAHADADMCGSISADVFQDKDKNEIVSETNLDSVLDDTERDEKEAQIVDALEADINKVEEEKLPLTNDGAVDNVVRSGEVEENLSLSTPTVAQSDDLLEAQRDDDAHESEPVVSVQDSETEISHANLTEDAIFLNNGTNHVAQQADELQNIEQSSGKVDLGLISDNDDDIVSTQNTANTKEHVVAVSVVAESLTEKKDENLVQHEELDVQADSVSQTDSVEGNWGSVSVLSAFSDAPASTEKTNLQPKPDILPKETKTPFEHQNGSVTEEQTSEQANEPSGSKKNEEIIAKVTNWSTASGKHQHMSLKSILGGSSSPNPVDNPPLKKPQETMEAQNDGVKGEEWNSPARYPTNIKREKVKVKSKPYWAPFICCSSSNYH